MFNKEWLLARYKEVSTKWGMGVIVVLVALFFNAQEIGDWTQRVTAVAGMAAAIRLVMVQEATKKEDGDGNS